jgi:hypothetical protein
MKLTDFLRKEPELFALYGYSQAGSISTPKLTFIPVSSSPFGTHHQNLR